MARPTKPVDQSTFAGQVGARIRARRWRQKLTVQAAAELAGMPAPTWYHCEDGRHLALDRLPAIAAALECTVRSLIPPG